jgi:hypothetical protein
MTKKEKILTEFYNETKARWNEFLPYLLHDNRDKVISYLEEYEQKLKHIEPKKPLRDHTLYIQ